MARGAQADNPQDCAVAGQQPHAPLVEQREVGVGEYVAHQARAFHAEWGEAVAVPPAA